MAVVAGIDEAGFGPLLGPLVVSAVVLEVPDEHVDADLWRLLAPAVVRKPSRRGGVAVADSKKLFHRSRRGGLEHLERGVLAFRAAQGRPAESLLDLLAGLNAGVGDELADYPWYVGRNLPLPRCISSTDVRLAGNVLSAGLKRAGVKVLDPQARPVLAGRFNRIVGATNNKSVTLFDVTAGLLVDVLAGLARRSAGGTIRIFADRHGGRVRYRRQIQRTFPGCGLRILDESPELSGYRVTGRKLSFELYFGTGFDERRLPVALASMISKYVRELFMELFNAFWTDRAAGVKPTAGYYKDAIRFLREIAPVLEAMRIDERLLRRCR